jgi:hypothetical protein
MDSHQLAEVCEWEDCLRFAEYQIWAQWTVVDFEEWQACPDHAMEMLQELSRKRVDGHPVVELTATRVELSP